MSRIILHCDLNNFFASVECLKNPKLNQEFVAVCGNTEERKGIVLAKNQKAKAMGVTTGEPIWQARKKCPSLIVVPPHYEEYVSFAQEVRRIYDHYTDQIEPFGIDECWLDITASTSLFGDGYTIAETIRQRIKKEIGLTISVGISFNKVFAKLASDLKKPDAVTEIESEHFREKIWGLPAYALLGVGKKTYELLSRHCVRTIGDIAQTNPEFLQIWLGKNGLLLHRFSNGKDTSPVMRSDFISPIKSVGHGTTTAKDLKTPEEVWLIILELCQSIGSSLRFHKKIATGVSVMIRNNQLTCQEWQCKLPYPSQNSLCIAKAAYQLFLSHYTWNRDIRSVTVRSISLEEQKKARQINLFENFSKQEKTEKLDTVIDVLRQKYHNDSILKHAVLLQNSMPSASPAPFVSLPSGLHLSH